MSISPEAINGFLEMAYPFRMELVFLVTFVLLWLLNHSLGDSNSKAASKASAVRRWKPRPPTGRWGARWGSKADSPASVVKRRETNFTQHSGISSDFIQEIRDPTASDLCNPTWLAAAVQMHSRTQVQKAVDLYHEALKAGLNLEEMPKVEGAQLFMALVTSTIRVGCIDVALGFLQDCRRGPGLTAALLASCTKLCTSKQLFKESLMIYDFFAQDPTIVMEDRSVWSCLLFCAVEARSYSRCSFLFKSLQTYGAPSNKDYGNMVRCASTHGDWKMSLSLIQKMRQAGLEVDSVVYNTALATCVAANKTDEARKLLEDMESTGGVADVITYNTLSKGYAKAGRMDQCFELFEHMKARAIAPSQVTYGILLDCCINEKHMDRAAEVFNDMSSQGLVMNTVLYTTLIKGFARAEQLDQAMRVYEQMSNDRDKGVSPDLITFSILIKANCDGGRVSEALGLLRTMKALALCPDEVVFNNLLGGCVRDNNPELAKRLYNEMIEGGIRPSNATFSILIRLYAQSKLLDEAVEMLKKEPEARKVEPESRLYVQLAQACLRERQGRRALEVYKLMIERNVPTAAMHGSLLGMCSKLNMLDTAAEILSLASETNGRIDVRDAMHLRESAVRKRKPACVEAISAAMTRLGLDLNNA
jgi:pentatricopeptide repeat protein